MIFGCGHELNGLKNIAISSISELKHYNSWDNDIDYHLHVYSILPRKTLYTPFLYPSYGTIRLKGWTNFNLYSCTILRSLHKNVTNC